MLALCAMRLSRCSSSALRATRSRTLCSSASQRCVLYVYNVCRYIYVYIYNSCIDTKAIYTYTYINIYIHIFIYTIRLPKGGPRRVRCLLTYAHVCSRMLAYAGICSQVARDEYAVCSRMLTHSHVCSRMMTYDEVWYKRAYATAHVCSRMMTYAHVCSRILRCGTGRRARPRG